MKFLITEKVSNGAYFKSVTDAENRICSATYLFGPRFSEQIKQLGDGFIRETVIESSDSSFRMKGNLELAQSGAVPSVRDEEVVA